MDTIALDRMEIAGLDLQKREIAGQTITDNHSYSQYY